MIDTTDDDDDDDDMYDTPCIDDIYATPCEDIQHNNKSVSWS